MPAKLKDAAREEPAEAPVFSYGSPGWGDPASLSGRVDGGESVRDARDRPKAKRRAADPAVRGSAPRQLLEQGDRRANRRKRSGVGERVLHAGGPLELDFAPAPVFGLDAGVEVGQSLPAGSRRTLLAGDAFPIPPSINAYYGDNIVWSKKQQRYIANRYVTHEGKAYQKMIAERLLEMQKWFRSESPLRLEILVCFHDDRRQDISNRLKVLEDALTNGNVMLDDKQVEELEIRRGPNIKHGAVMVRLTEILPTRQGNLQWIRRPA